MYSYKAIAEVLYNNFAYRVGPDEWEELEPMFFAELEATESAQDELLEANGLIKQLVDAVENGNYLRIDSALQRASAWMAKEE